MPRHKLPTRARLHQILRWIHHEFEPKKRISLRVVKKMPKGFEDAEGAVWVDGPSPLIRIPARLRRSTAIYALLHEVAHCLLVERNPRGWRGGEHEGVEHGDKFYRILGTLERAFTEGGEGISMDF